MTDHSNQYRNTLNLPQTEFPMKAGLARREPEVLKKWDESGLYAAILKKNEGRPKYILHDGPPYANGSIHFGHILNKTLKDIIIKYKNMSGFQSPYVPGWDCHGLPIEHQVDKDLGSKKRDMSKLDIRKACREYAMKFIEIQKKDFRRLGILGDWDHPYLTMSTGYEAAIAREFGRFVRKGDVYNALRPVLWCASCRTALADAETEYEEKESPSIYVRFRLVHPEKLSSKLKDRKVSIVIWTTTPWTLPANLAIAVHENYDYVAVSCNVSGKDEVLIVANQLLGSFFETLGSQENPEPVERFSGKKLEKQEYEHPFLEKKEPHYCQIVLSDHVSLDTGTGCVHIAPGHGEDDYNVGLKNGLPILSPVDHAGRFTEEVGAPEWVGLKIFEANEKVIEKLGENDALAWQGKIRHSYPHCWRCKNPLIFRATEQYFLSLEKNALRAKALDAIRRVHWIPSWGRERIYGMVERRGDWCLSRQRSWGVPIVSFRCANCADHVLLAPDVIDRAADLFEKETSDIWFDESFKDPQIEELLTKHSCPKCHTNRWTKENHILDVWFDSGVSFAAVLEKNPLLQFPADLYLEGSDQHRGWFHASLLACVGTRDRAPYQSVLTHGFVVDSQGKKYSKSAKNYVPPDKILQENGAEILRLWVAAEDYRNDIRVSNEILTRLVEAYRKIRNTSRFLLGNLHGFEPKPNEAFAFQEIDLWALHHLQKLIQRAQEAYDEFNFHLIFHDLNRFCTVEMSAFYLDIIKDRLYTSAPNDPSRRAAQKVLFELASVLARLMAPILSFTSEEIWQHLPASPGKASSIHLADFPVMDPQYVDEAMAGRWDDFLRIRDEILKALEIARQGKVIGNSLEAKLTLVANDIAQTILLGFENLLPDLFMVSQVEWGLEISPDSQPASIPGLFMHVRKADGHKCDRCWKWRTSVGKCDDHPGLCESCCDVLSGRIK